jgi:putrescine aminotransferase
MTRMSVANLKEADARSLWHPMAHPKSMLTTPPDIIARGEGSWIWDIDGKRLVDGVAGLWTVNLGFGRQEIRNAIMAQLDELAYYNVFRGTTHPRAIELLPKWRARRISAAL